MSDLFSSIPEVREGLERIGWRRVPFGAPFGYSWQDARGQLYTEYEAQAAWLRYEREREEGR